MIKRIMIEVAMDQLSFSEMSIVAPALSAMEALAGSTHHVAIRVEDVTGLGVLRKRRKDAKDVRAIQPQARIVLSAIDKRIKATVTDLVKDTGLIDSSVRAQLTILQRRRLVDKQGKYGRKIMWVSVPKPVGWDAETEEEDDQVAKNAARELIR
jgi:hypothetical protein